jgi:hypothetical protein
MEEFSRMNGKKRLPWKIDLHPYLYDHHVEGKAIFPAVEALITLACAVKTNFPQAGIDSLEQAAFQRFLTLPEDARELAVTVELQVGEGSITAALLTESKTNKANIRRSFEHARVKFSTICGTENEPPSFYDSKKLKGEGINVPAVAIYRELVPFGKAYQNIEGDLSVSADGALAYLSGGNAEAGFDLLGSPFPLDAVMHAACVWGQRFTDSVPFPVGFARRIIYRKTEKRATYLGRIVPVDVNSRTLIFDAWIYDLNGIIYEHVSGIQMQDVSRGRKKPPAWIQEGA